MRYNKETVLGQYQIAIVDIAELAVAQVDGFLLREKPHWENGLLKTKDHPGLLDWARRLCGEMAEMPESALPETEIAWKLCCRAEIVACTLLFGAFEPTTWEYSLEDESSTLALFEPGAREILGALALDVLVEREICER